MEKLVAEGPPKCLGAHLSNEVGWLANVEDQIFKRESRRPFEEWQVYQQRERQPRVLSGGVISVIGARTKTIDSERVITQAFEGIDRCRAIVASIGFEYVLITNPLAIAEAGKINA